MMQKQCWKKIFSIRRGVKIIDPNGENKSCSDQREQRRLFIDGSVSSHLEKLK